MSMADIFQRFSEDTNKNLKGNLTSLGSKEEISSNFKSDKAGSPAKSPDMKTETITPNFSNLLENVLPQSKTLDSKLDIRQLLQHFHFPNGLPETPKNLIDKPKYSSSLENGQHPQVQMLNSMAGSEKAISSLSPAKKRPFQPDSGTSSHQRHLDIEHSNSHLTENGSTTSGRTDSTFPIFKLQHNSAKKFKYGESPHRMSDSNLGETKASDESSSGKLTESTLGYFV